MPTDLLVLNVDDREEPRYAKSRLLQAAGFRVIEADCGRAALDLVAEQRPAIIVLDVKLPDISGYEVCAEVKRDYPTTMVLHTSATYTSGDDRSRGLESGADGYLVQPIEPRELIATVRALGRIHQAETRMRLMNESLERRVQHRTAELELTNSRLLQEIDQRERAEQALVQAQKMEAMGQLTGGIAHDFNNLLTVIIGNLHLLSAHGTGERPRRWADHALQAATRAAKLTEQLLAFSRTQKLVTRPTELAALLAGMEELLRQSLGAGNPLRLALEPDLPRVRTDANQLELAILNLAINARDAMPDGGAVEISARRVVVESGQHGLAAGEYVLLAIADSGHGMTPEVAARAFDPFFTTKPVGKGTGLGLSQVYGIARQSGGTVTVDTAPGRGTTMGIWLPVALQAGEAEPEASARIPARPRLLVVDDEANVREVLATVLRELGAEVMEADGAQTALDLLEQGARPDLAVLDYAMPGRNGVELALDIRQRHPQARILFLSGHADILAASSQVPGARVLRKPFLPAGLASAVTALLGAD